MMPPIPRIEPLPPRLAMDAYADLVGETIRRTPTERIARQKAMEKRIATAFRMSASAEYERYWSAELDDIEKGDARGELL